MTHGDALEHMSVVARSKYRANDGFRYARAHDAHVNRLICENRHHASPLSDFNKLCVTLGKLLMFGLITVVACFVIGSGNREP